MKKQGPLLEVQNLQMDLPIARGFLRAVDNVSFSLYPGKTLAIVGESGSGKSLTAASIMRLLPLGAQCGHKSKILFDGHDLLALTERELQQVRGKKIGMVFQEPMTALNPVLSIRYQIAETLRHHFPLSVAQLRAQSHRLLEQVGLPRPEQILRAYPHELSGGQRQRVAIAIALAGEPDILIADEPTTALDVTIQAQILHLLADLQKQRQMGLLLITHDLSVVASLADEVSVMYAGQIVEQAPVEQFFSRPAHPYSQALFASMPRKEHREQVLFTLSGRVPDLAQKFRGCRFADRCPSAKKKCSTHEIPWVEMNKTQSIRCDIPLGERDWKFIPGKTTLPAMKKSVAHAEEAETPLLTLKNVHVNFSRKNHWWEFHGKLAAVDGVSLSLYPGKTLALVGESGSGKTTLAKALLRLVYMSSGTIMLNDGEARSIKNICRREQSKWMQMVWQDPYSSLDPRQSIKNILLEGLEVHGETAKSNSQKILEELVARVGLLPNSLSKYPHQFSGGQRQRIAIARALAAKPKILICDEPTSALDVSVQAQILNLLKDLQSESQLAYLLITHNMSVVEYLADTVAVMYRGRIVEFGDVNKVLYHPRHPYTKLLLNSVLSIDATQKKGK